MRPRRAWIWVGVGAGIILGVTAALWLRTPRPRPGPGAPATLFLARPYRGPVPQFEEPLPPGPPALSHRLAEAAFKALEELGVEGSGVHLMVRSQGRGEHVVMSGPLPEAVDELRLAAALRRTTAGMGATVESERMGAMVVGRIRAGEILYEIRLGPEHRPWPKPGGVALVVDDMGYRLKPARELVGLGLRITLSVLPWAPYARQVAQLARKAGLEVLVHLPMQPRAYPRLQPGPGALMLGMSPQELARLTREAIARVPGASGANNHMGSAFTEDPCSLEVVFRVLKARGMFFLDSLTSPRSCARQVAAKVGIRFASRWLFIDHDPSPRAISTQLKRLVRLGRMRASVVAIAHPYPQTIAALKRMAPELRKTLNLVRVATLARIPARARALARSPSAPQPSSPPSPHQP